MPLRLDPTRPLGYAPQTPSPQLSAITQSSADRDPRLQEAYWSEIDSVMVLGTVGGPAAVEVSGVVRQPWETNRQFRARGRFVAGWRQEHGEPASEADELRETALSMVYSNNVELGCRYPEVVQAAVGLRAAGTSGLAVEGEMRAAGVARGA